MMKELTYWVTAIFAVLFAVFALSDIRKQKDHLPSHYRWVMTVLILLLPLVGSVIYYRQKDSMAKEVDRLSRR